MTLNSIAAAGAAQVVFMRGGGDLASGVALRLFRCGLPLVIAELPQPQVVRRLASFAEAVFRGRYTLEEVTAVRVDSLEEALCTVQAGLLPVLVDPPAAALAALRPTVLVDARMTKKPPQTGLDAAPLVIGLGPGFVAGQNCHAVVETQRGHFLGRVLWQGAAQPDTGVPEKVGQVGIERVLRAPCGGILTARAEIGDRLAAGQPVAEVDGQVVLAPFAGVLRGLLHSGITVSHGFKIGDLDPRGDPRYCTLVSDKALAVGGGVLEAILSRPELRSPWSY